MTSTVAICGSCTSRDPFNSRFNSDYADWFTVAADVFQTSMISLMSPAMDQGADLAELFSGPGSGAEGQDLDYRVRITREDATRVFLTKLAATRPQYLVLDFFADIHFGAVQLPDGRYLTNNRWMLWPTRYHARLKETGGLVPLRIFRDPDAYVALWSEALDRFAAFVAEHCPGTQVIVHRGLNTDEVVVPERAWPLRLAEHRKTAALNVARANKLWARLDDYAVETHGWTAIDLRDEGYTSYAEHPWKSFYVHYTPDYYHRFLAEMLAIDLAGEVSADDAAQLEGINAAGHARAVAEAERWTPVRLELDERIRELEGLSTLGAAKFAIGQRIRKTRAVRANKKEAR